MLLDRVKMFTIQSAEFIKSAPNARNLIKDDLPQIAFAGRSNVGKSSLINTLVNQRQLARASSTPGRTREVNYFKINGGFYFVDLPGYGYAKAPKSMRNAWRPLVEAYLANNSALRVAIVILDVRRIPSGGDLELIDWLEQAGLSYLPILTKRDKLTKNAFAKQEKNIRASLGLEDPLAVFSSKTREGKEPLLEMIGDLTRPKP